MLLCYRTNIAIMFMSDLVLDGLEIDWSAHLPLMLHVIFLGKEIAVIMPLLPFEEVGVIPSRMSFS